MGFSVNLNEYEEYMYIIFCEIIITARKQNLGQGNVFTCICHSVHKGKGSLSRRGLLDREALDRGPVERGTPEQRPPEQRPLLDRDPPWTETPSGQRPPSEQRPSQTDTPCTVKNGRYASYWNVFLL